VHEWDVGDPVFNAWALLRQASEAIETAVEVEIDARGMLMD